MARNGQFTNRQVNVAIGVRVNGERVILALEAGSGGEGQFLVLVLNAIKTRSVEDACITACNRPKGLPEASPLLGPRQWSKPASGT